MDNLLKPVIENYSKYYVEKQKCPTYVQMYAKDSKEIILVYNKVSTQLHPLPI